jgi:predicted transcriptional regulator
MPRKKSVHFQLDANFKASCLLASKFFLFFSNPTALMILDVLRKKESTSQQLVKELGIGRKMILSKLKAMEKERILISYAISRDVYYRIADAPILKAFDQILEFPEKRLKADTVPVQRTDVAKQVKACSARAVCSTRPC